MILSLGDSHSKKLIGTIVIVALLINFSLFFTRVIIDGSNILAKVFYNNITITNQDSKTGATGEKSVSVALISKFNPQKLVTQKIYDGDHGVAMFIFITLIAMCVVLYAAYIFFSVGVLFVSRVVMLWISMIFAPIAFISYTLPFEIPGLGHKDWWKELLQNAFLAPIFIFFLYIITMFTDFLKDIVKFPDGADIMQKIMAVIIPFAILTILLMKAKEMAVKYAGEMGAAMQKAGAMVGGLAVGAATGGAAMLGRGTVGRLGSVIGRSETLKDAEKKGGLTGFMAARLRDTGNAAGKGSFDARGVKIAGKSLASTGLQVGSAQTGGFEKRRADQVAKRQQRADSLKLGEDSKEKQNLYKTDADLHGLNAEIEKEMEGIDKLIERKRQEAADAERELKAAEGNPEESAKAKVNLTRKNNQLKEAKERKDALRAGKEYTYIDDAGEEQIQKAHTSHNGMNLAQLETQKKDQLKDITKIDNERMHTYAESQASAGAQTLDFITSMGQHSFRGAREAENKIKTGAKAPASSGGGGGHGGGGDSHGGGEHPPKKESAPPKDTHKDEHGGGGDHGHGK